MDPLISSLTAPGEILHDGVDPVDGSAEQAARIRAAHAVSAR
ncbi:MAG TPA: hypothetical protein VEZ42_13070 [Pseudonocardia sp.]|nr:hypothetical protein [Pseudonocardia sp.]